MNLKKIFFLLYMLINNSESINKHNFIKIIFNYNLRKNNKLRNLLINNRNNKLINFLLKLNNKENEDKEFNINMHLFLSNLF